MADDPQVPRAPDNAVAAVLLSAASHAALRVDAPAPNTPTMTASVGKFLSLFFPSECHST